MRFLVDSWWIGDYLKIPHFFTPRLTKEKGLKLKWYCVQVNQKLGKLKEVLVTEKIKLWSGFTVEVYICATDLF